MEQKKQLQLPFITTTLVIINFVIWIIMELAGDTTDGYYMVEWGAAYAPWIVENGEWWRMFTCMFLHFGAEHLVSNMLMLFVLGTMLERALGKLRYGILYIFSGLSGSALSCYITYASGDYAISAGASGAVFGIVGGLTAWTVWHRGQIEGLTVKKMFIMLGISLVYGFTESNVDNWGHLGGLIGGFLIGSIWAILKKIDFMLKNQYTRK